MSAGARVASLAALPVAIFALAGRHRDRDHDHRVASLRVVAP
ncbi:MAG: hypothetical protein QOG42_116 [Solirubrobacteraceae bacterium]|jgi:hypothetical protein|nr:hypothetical protein [Solirubrobacteraceae bacterium]